MDRIVYRLTLDAMKGGIQKILQGFNTGEDLARRIVINIVANGHPLLLSENHVACMYVTKPNMTEPCINECVIEENQIIYDVLRTDIDAEGLVKMKLKVIDDGAVLMSPSFAMEVNESEADDTGATKTPTYTALEQALLKANEVYNGRITSISLDDDHIFHVNYADGTSYESDTLVALLGIEEAEESRILAEEGRVKAEVERQTAFSKAITETNTATQNANNIVDDVYELLNGGGIATPTQIANWDASAHTHDNKDILDNTTASFTAEDKQKLDNVSEYEHPVSGVTAGTYLNVTVDKNGHVTEGNNNVTHKHLASDVTAGTLGGDVSAPATTNYSGQLVRNIVVLDADPGEGASVNYNNGTIIFAKG